MNDNGIFRKVALDRLSSPDQLDQLLPVTDRRGWLALLAFALAISATVAWSLVGSIPLTVRGSGILVGAGGVSEVALPTGGQILKLEVGVGDQVEKGQVVARVSQFELETKLEQEKTALEHLVEQDAEMRAHAAQDVPLQKEQLEKQRRAILKAIESATKLKRDMTEKIVSQTQLVEEGLLLKAILLETRQRRDGAIERIKESHSQLAEIAVRESELENRRIEQDSAIARRITEARVLVEDLERELKKKASVVSAHAGRVLEVLAESGAVLGTGAPLLTLGGVERSSAGLEAIIFVPSVFGKQIKPGMSVLVAPSTVKQEEFGMILANVTAVSEFPATAEGMRRILKNDKLVASLSGQDAPYEVRMELVSDPTTTSKYRWSSSKGPPIPIENGTLAMANIAVKRRRPVELVIPLLKERTGL